VKFANFFCFWCVSWRVIGAGAGLARRVVISSRVERSVGTHTKNTSQRIDAPTTPTYMRPTPRPPLPGVLRPSLQERTNPIVAMGERFASDDLYRARALLSHARRHLVRVGSLKFGRLWAMRRRKDDGECRAMMGTATTTATNYLKRYIRTNIYLL
jgi:hypothetical protein